jgi:hypothetical protein
MNCYEKVREVKKRIETELLRKPGVTGVDIKRRTGAEEDTDQFAIVIYVAEKQDRPKEEALPKEIEGIPVEVVQRSFKPF